METVEKRTTRNITTQEGRQGQRPVDGKGRDEFNGPGAATGVTGEREKKSEVRGGGKRKCEREKKGNRGDGIVMIEQGDRYSHGHQGYVPRFGDEKRNDMVLKIGAERTE